MDKQEETANFLVVESDKTSPKQSSIIKTPKKEQGSKSPERATEFNMKETQSDEGSEQCAIVQVPKPIEPFDHKNDLSDDEEDKE